MKFVLLTILMMPLWVEAQPLVYASYIYHPKDKHLMQPITDVIEHLFASSQFQLESRKVNRSTRLVAEAAAGRIDILVGSYTPAINKLMAEGVLDVHPLPLIPATRGFYALRRSEYSPAVLDNLSRYHLGMTETPSIITAVVLGSDFGRVSKFRRGDSLVKGLLTGRIDILVNYAWATDYSFERLGVSDKVVKLGEGPKIDAHVYIRASLPEQTKREIFELLDRRIPKLVTGQGLQKMLMRYRYPVLIEGGNSKRSLGGA